MHSASFASTLPVVTVYEEIQSNFIYERYIYQQEIIFTIGY